MNSINKLENDIKNIRILMVHKKIILNSNYGINISQSNNLYSDICKYKEKIYFLNKNILRIKKLKHILNDNG